jgi:hypothetical protein
MVKCLGALQAHAWLIPAAIRQFGNAVMTSLKMMDVVQRVRTGGATSMHEAGPPMTFHVQGLRGCASARALPAATMAVDVSVLGPGSQLLRTMGAQSLAPQLTPRWDVEGWEHRRSMSPVTRKLTRDPPAEHPVFESNGHQPEHQRRQWRSRILLQDPFQSRNRTVSWGALEKVASQATSSIGKGPTRCSWKQRRPL